MSSAPRNISASAAVMVASGLFNILGMSWISGLLLSLVGGVLSSLAFCPVGFLCGFGGCLFVPLGIAELIVGLWGFNNPKNALPFLKLTAWLQLAGIVTGAVGSAIAGIISISLLASPEVEAYRQEHLR